VSREFLLNTLRYPETAIERLKESEKRGGVSTTGDLLMVEGACHLTWYHSKSTQVFRGMRFLISPNPRCDLVIGARSIERHNLLSPPNLMTIQAIGDPNGTFMEYYGEAYETPNLTMNLDPEVLKLTTKLAKIENELKLKKTSLKTAAAGADRKSPEQIEAMKEEKSQKEKEHKVAELDIKLYNANVAFNKDKSAENRKLVDDAENELKEALKALGTDDGKETVLEEPKGETSTGRSPSNGSAIKRHGKHV